MLKILKYSAVAFIAATAFLWAIDYCYSGGDAEVRANAVQLVGGGSCSGEQVIAASGRKYILTAEHCKDLSGDKSSITVKTEDGRTLERNIVAEDVNSDLLLLEGVPGIEGLQIANKYEAQQNIRTFTHGAGLPLYKTNGVLIGKRYVNIMLGVIGVNYRGDCKEAKNIIGDVETPLGGVKACGLHVEEAVSTAAAVPGSSGGIVVNDANELIGVVSATDGSFSYFVTLKDIKSLLANY